MPRLNHALTRVLARRTTGRSRRRTARGAAALAVAAAVVVPLAAYAADGPYNIEGTVPDAGTTELADPFGNVKELGPLNSNTTKIGVIHNDALPTLDTTNPNGQVDLRRAWLDTERDASTNHDWLYFAWERDNNSGSGFIAYEFMQNPAPAGCAYDTATDAQLIAELQPVGQPHGRRLPDPVGPAGRQQGPLPAHLDRHRTQPDAECADAAQRRRVAGGVQPGRVPRRGSGRPDRDHLRRLDGLPDVRQHDPEHRDRQLRHGRLQGHHPQERAAHHQLRLVDGDHAADGRRR